MIRPGLIAFAALLALAGCGTVTSLARGDCQGSPASHAQETLLNGDDPEPC